MTEHDRRRLALSWRLLLAGVVLGVLAAIALAVAGAGGAAGFVVVVFGTAFGTVLGALVGGVLAVVDEIRGAPVATRRVLVVFGLFAATVVLVTLGVAAGSGA